MASTPNSAASLLRQLGLEHVVDVGDDAALEQHLDQVARLDAELVGEVAQRHALGDHDRAVGRGARRAAGPRRSRRSRRRLAVVAAPAPGDPVGTTASSTTVLDLLERAAQVLSSAFGVLGRRLERASCGCVFVFFLSGSGERTSRRRRGRRATDAGSHSARAAGARPVCRDRRDGPGTGPAGRPPGRPAPGAGRSGRPRTRAAAVRRVGPAAASRARRAAGSPGRSGGTERLGGAMDQDRRHGVAGAGWRRSREADGRRAGPAARRRRAGVALPRRGRRGGCDRRRAPERMPARAIGATPAPRSSAAVSAWLDGRVDDPGLDPTGSIVAPAATARAGSTAGSRGRRPQRRARTARRRRRPEPPRPASGSGAARRAG